jgi:hypothetical protein
MSRQIGNESKEVINMDLDIMSMEGPYESAIGNVDWWLGMDSGNVDWRVHKNIEQKKGRRQLVLYSI